jgi:hypothetical protein
MQPLMGLATVKEALMSFIRHVVGNGIMNPRTKNNATIWIALYPLQMEGGIGIDHLYSF